jgi:hypothetical protein
VNGPEHRLTLWGILGGVVAATFAVWLLFFPDLVPTRFAWDVHPRMAQLFIAAGYVFRTAFFFSIARDRRWMRTRWMFWGNLVFTGTLLLATFWHAQEFAWGQFVPPTAHFWILLYIFEPVTMLYLVPRGEAARAPAPPTGGPLLPLFRGFLVFETGILLMIGSLLVINPEMAAQRWPWELNPLDARMIAAWFLGWSAWAGTMAFAADWDEIRLATRLQILNGVALTATIVVMFSSFHFSGPTSSAFYVVGVIGCTIVMIGFHALQERRRPEPPVSAR